MGGRQGGCRKGEAVIVHDMPQRSQEWYAVRAGKLTGSAAADMLATIKSGEAVAKRDLRVRLVVERLTGKPQESGYINADMQRGIDCEPLALAAYEVLTGELVTTCGFVSHDTHEAGCSPDAYVGDWDGLVSIKCPKSATHLSYLKAGTFPAAYVPQMLHELWITGAKYYDFISWDDRFPEWLQTFYVRVPRDEAAVAEYAAKAVAFLNEVQLEVDGLLGWSVLKESA